MIILASFFEDSRINSKLTNLGGYDEVLSITRRIMDKIHWV